MADALDRLGPVQREIVRLGHVDRDPQGSLWAALPDPTLEEPQLAALDRELDVAQVPVEALERHGIAFKLARHGWQADRELGQCFGLVAARDDVLALCVEHHVAVHCRLARGRISGEQHARARVDAAIPEDHRLDRDGRPEIVRDALPLPIRPRPVAVPRAEHRLSRCSELDPRIVGYDIDADDVLEHLLEARPAVGREAQAGRSGRQTPRRLVVEAQIEDRIHHPGHRDGGAGTNRDEERVVGVPEASADALLDGRHVLADLGVEATRPSAREVRIAGSCGDRKRGRDRQPKVEGHDGKVGCLATNEGLDLSEREPVAVVVVVDPAQIRRTISWQLIHRGAPVATARSARASAAGPG